MRILYALPAITWTLLIFIACTWPASQLPKVSLINADKLFHAGVFLFFTWLWNYALRKWGVTRMAGLWRSALAGVLYGVLIEVIQGLFVPNRMFDPLDMLANTFGCIAAFLTWWLLVPAAFPARAK